YFEGVNFTRSRNLELENPRACDTLLVSATAAETDQFCDFQLPVPGVVKHCGVVDMFIADFAAGLPDPGHKISCAATHNFRSIRRQAGNRCPTPLRCRWNKADDNPCL